MSLENINENTKSIQVNNSLVYLKLKENSHSRALKTIPDENSNSFLVSTVSNNESEIIKITYDESNKQLTKTELIKFEQKEDEIINDIYEIYPKNINDFYINCFNFSKGEYELKLIKKNESNEYEVENIPSAHSEFPFDITNFASEDNIINFISNNQVQTIDLNKKNINGVIPLYENESKPIKISSDFSLVDSNTIAIGLNNNIFICDLTSQKIINQINDFKNNSILSLQYDPSNSYILCSSGTDYSIKFWDLRKSDIELGGIYNNSHWIWCNKFNQNYSNMLITASSSSNVRCVIFSKIENENDDFGFNKNLRDYSFIDYSEFEDSVYSVDWLKNDSWTFAAISFNSYFHINTIPEDIKYKIML